MIDPLTEVVTLLQPSAQYSKYVRGASPWAISRTVAGEPFYCAILDGGCRIAIDGHAPIALLPGDFMLIPAAYGVAMSSLEPPAPGIETAPPVALDHGEYRIGDPANPVDTRMMAGNCSFGSPDASLLVSLLPRYVHVRGEPRLTTLVQLVRDESRAQRPAREIVLARLLEVLLIEALRFTAGRRPEAMWCRTVITDTPRRSAASWTLMTASSLTGQNIIAHDDNVSQGQRWLRDGRERTPLPAAERPAKHASGGRNLRADARIRTGDPFITSASSASSGRTRVAP